MKFKIIVILLSISTLLGATTIYYNGENDDIAEWSIQTGSLDSARISEVHDNTLDSTVMEFTDGGIYRLRLPNNQMWNNATEHMLSFDINLDSSFTLDVYVNTEQGWRKFFLNGLNIHVGHHNGGIRFAFGGNRLFRNGGSNTGFVNRGWGDNPEYQNNRNGWVRVTADLDRILRDLEPDNRIVNVLFMRISGTAGRIDNVTLDNPTRVTRATTEADWRISPTVPNGGTISRVQDNAERGMVIELDGAVNSNSFTTGARVGEGLWNDTAHDTVQWKIQTEDPFKFIVHVNTQRGRRNIVYYAGKRRADDDRWWTRPLSPVVERGFDATHNEINIGLGVRKHLGDDAPDNNGDGVGDYDSGVGPTWKTFTRNIAMDVAEFENGNTLRAINGVTVIGTNSFEHGSPMINSTIRVDDIQFFTSITPSEGGNNNQEGSATDLHRWRLRETSVRVSFVDNANNETGFRYINADTGVQMGETLPATDGTGVASIGQINGLTAGTTYRIQVQTLFANNQVSTSEALEFTTLGNIGNTNPATNLTSSNVSSASATISFRDNSEGEAGFRFIEELSGEQIGDAMPPIAGMGETGSGILTNLFPLSTYHIRVETFFTDGRENQLSEMLDVSIPSEHIDEVATNLHRWSLRNTSVKISFVDNAEGEESFRFINADTRELLGTLPASNGTGIARIGRINNLTPNTTYRILVSTRFFDPDTGGEAVDSEPIVFTTLE